MSSFFSQLSKFRHREGRNPEEDFFTEVFIGVLRKDFSLSKKIIHRLTGFELKNIHFKTQTNCSGYGRPDVEISGEQEESGTHIVIYLENKLNAVEGRDQLWNYSQILMYRGRNRKDSCLLFLTKRNYSKEEIYEKYKSKEEAGKEYLSQIIESATWFEVFSLLQDYFNSNESKIKDYLGDLIAFMEDLGMNNNINISDLAILAKIPDSLEAMYGLVYNSLDLFKKEYIDRNGKMVSGCSTNSIYAYKKLKTEGSPQSYLIISYRSIRISV